MSEEMMKVVALKPIDGCAVEAEIELPKGVAEYMIANGAAEAVETPSKTLQMSETGKGSSSATKDDSKGVKA